MKRSLLIPALAAVIALGAWQLANAQTADSTGAAPGSTTPGTTTTTTTTTPTGDATSTTTTTTAPATPAPSAAYLAARERGKSAAAKDVDTIDKQLTTVVKSVDDQAAKAGDATIAGRLASDFGVSSDALMAEKAKYNVGWGDLMIAHTLGSNTLTGVTVDEILTMRTTDTLGWGSIAGGLDLKLGNVVSGIKSQAKVATGASRADGKPAKISVATTTTGSTESGSSTSSGSSSGSMSPSGDAGTPGK